MDAIDQIWDISFGLNKFKENIGSVMCINCITSDDNEFIETDGFIVCTKCGLIIKNIISDTAEWNNYTDTGGATSNNSRCGYSVKTTDINPYTNTTTSFMPKGVKNVCYKDGKLMKYDISKVHVQNSTNHLQKSFCQVENLLDNVAEEKYSQRIIFTAKALWADVMKSNKVTRAGVRKGLIACCLYYSCVYHDCTRSPLEICKDFGMSSTKQFNKGDGEFKVTFENSAMKVSVEWNVTSALPNSLVFAGSTFP